MNTRLLKTYQGLAKFLAGDVIMQRHHLTVYANALLIAEGEGLTGEALEVLEAAALVHDIGAKPALEKYGDPKGWDYHEEEGIKPAEEVLAAAGYKKDFIDKVTFLVSHHQTYENITDFGLQILIEADFLVNLQNDKMVREYAWIFKTETGKSLLKELFPIS